MLILSFSAPLLNHFCVHFIEFAWNLTLCAQYVCVFVCLCILFWSHSLLIFSLRSYTFYWWWWWRRNPLFDGSQNIMSKIVNDIASLLCRLSVSDIVHTLTGDCTHQTNWLPRRKYFLLCQFLHVHDGIWRAEKRGYTNINGFHAQGKFISAIEK